MDTLPVLAADLTIVKVNGGRAFADLVNWDEDADPYEGQRVLLADGGSQRHEALIRQIRADGTALLSVTAHEKPDVHEWG